MTMVIGDRKIVGVIKRRADARAIYEQALAQGQTASLLEQERPNIFTQSVGNIKPKQEVKIIISYFDVLKYDMGIYEFHFPMVVGPRYNAGAKFAGTPAPVAPAAGTPAGAMPAAGVNPPVLAPGTRNGHDISLAVGLDAGVPIRDIVIPNHKTDWKQTGATKATAVLSPDDAIPNKDFVLRYNVSGTKPEMAVLANCEHSGDGYFMLMIQPRIDEELAKAPPREVVFMVDVSGSMGGAPTQKNIEIMREFFQRSKPDDTFQVITFAGDSQKLFDKAVPATPENVQKALNFTNGMQGGGGTEMMKAIRMVLEDPTDPQRVRIVVMLTDGFIGNEAEIIEAVGKHAGDKIRFWTVGIGSAPNRFLLDGVAKKGGGASAVVELNTDPKEVVGGSIVERIHRAQLANIQIDWNGLSVFDVYPRKITELWAGRPVILFGRYMYGGVSQIKITGTAEGKPLTYTIEVSLPDGGARAHNVLSKVWARNKIEDLMAQMNYGEDAAIIEEVTQTALNYRLMSQYTSFVAVDEQDAPKLTEPAKLPRRVGIPVPLPAGVSFEGIFGSTAPAVVNTSWLSASESAPISKAPLSPGRSSAKANNATPSPVPTQPPAVYTRTGIASANSTITPPPAVYYQTVGAASPMPIPGSPGPAGIPGPVGAMGNASSVTYGNAANLPTNGLSINTSRFPIVTSTDGWNGFLNFDDANVAYGRSFKDAPASHWAYQAVSLTNMKQIAPQRHQEAQKALADAQVLQQKGDFAGAFRRAQQAYLLDLAAPNYAYDGTQTRAANLMQSVLDDQQAARVKDDSALGDKLNLVIRDQALKDALNAVDKAAKLQLTILPGSLEDAAELAGINEVRVSYLDLRNATVAQALDWLLTERSLTWTAEKKAITVGSTRRMPGASAWVYQIGALAIPQAKDGVIQTADAEKALDTFLHVSHLAIGQQGDDGFNAGTSVLLDADRMLVYGDLATHEKMQAFLQALASKDAKFDLTGPALAEARALQVQTAANWESRAQMREQQRVGQEQFRLLQALDTYSWQLLAGMTHGSVDDQAFTELQIAWNNPQMAKILNGQNAVLAYRSAWLINQTAQALPQDAKPIAKLAGQSAKLLTTQYPALVKQLTGKPDPMAYVSTLYATLALRDVQGRHPPPCHHGKGAGAAGAGHANPNLPPTRRRPAHPRYGYRPGVDESDHGRTNRRQ